MMIVNGNEEGFSDSNILITFFNQHTRKPLSVITMKEKFLAGIPKFTSPQLDIIFVINSFHNLWDENIVLSDNEIGIKKRSHQYKELVYPIGENIKQLIVDFIKDVKDKERLCQLQDKYDLEKCELCQKAKAL